MFVHRTFQDGQQGGGYRVLALWLQASTAMAIPMTGISSLWAFHALTNYELIQSRHDGFFITRVHAWRQGQRTSQHLLPGLLLQTVTMILKLFPHHVHLPNELEPHLHLIIQISQLPPCKTPQMSPPSLSSHLLPLPSLAA